MPRENANLLILLPAAPVDAICHGPRPGPATSVRGPERSQRPGRRRLPPGAPPDTCRAAQSPARRPSALNRRRGHVANAPRVRRDKEESHSRRGQCPPASPHGRVENTVSFHGQGTDERGWEAGGVFDQRPRGGKPERVTSASLCPPRWPGLRCPVSLSDQSDDHSYRVWTRSPRTSEEHVMPNSRRSLF